MNEDQIIRDMLLNSASHVDTSNFDDGPTILTLYDTITVLSRKNPEWLKDRFCQMIFAWQASMFLENHVDEVCKEKCPELRELCVEYRECKTMNGLPLDELFGIKALNYIMPKNEDPYFEEPFGTAPVRDSFFKIIDNNK